MSHVPLKGLVRSTPATVFTLLFGIAVVVGFGIALVKVVPGGADELHTYEKAVRCQKAPATPADPIDCRWTREYTVTRVHLHQKKGDMTYAILKSVNGVTRKTEYTNEGPVVSRLHQGDRVTATFWRGVLTEISAGGGSQRTDEAPVNWRARMLIFGLITIPSGILLIAVALWRLSRRAMPEPTPGMIATLSLAGAFFFAGLFSPLVLSVLGQGREEFWPVAAVWVPAALILTAVARTYVVKKRATEAAAG